MVVEIVRRKFEIEFLGGDCRNASPVSNILERHGEPTARPGLHNKERSRDPIDRKRYMIDRAPATRVKCGEAALDDQFWY